MDSVGDLIKHFRTVVRDDTEPYLWSDDELVRYAADAYTMFARLTGGIADATSEAAEVAVTAGERFVTLHPSVLHINSAELPDGKPLKIVNYTDEQRRLPSYSRDTSGRLLYMVVGEQQGVARLVNVPTVDTTLHLRIRRLPLQRIEGVYDTLDEIDEMHHMYLAYWMMYLAYQKQDADAFNAKMSEEAAGTFSAYCTRVAREWERYKAKPRSVSYGGL